MEYVIEKTINATPNQVIKLLVDHRQIKNWITEIVDWKIISGEEGTTGAKTEIIIDAAGRTITITETILSIDAPQNVQVKYEMKGGDLIVDIDLISEGNQTLYRIKHQFNFSGVLKIATAVMKPAFMARSEKMVDDFKNLVERKKSAA